jgi:hypothetical protein
MGLSALAHWWHQVQAAFKHTTIPPVLLVPTVLNERVEASEWPARFHPPKGVRKALRRGRRGY